MPDNGPGGERRRGSLLGVVAYLLVPGERRREAAEHFRRAGMEAARGIARLAAPERAADDTRGETGGEEQRSQARRGGRQKIELD